MAGTLFRVQASHARAVACTELLSSARSYRAANLKGNFGESVLPRVPLIRFTADEELNVSDVRT